MVPVYWSRPRIAASNFKWMWCGGGVVCGVSNLESGSPCGEDKIYDGIWEDGKFGYYSILIII